jgi:hypothetical protein
MAMQGDAQPEAEGQIMMGACQRTLAGRGAGRGAPHQRPHEAEPRPAAALCYDVLNFGTERFL